MPANQTTTVYNRLKEKIRQGEYPPAEPLLEKNLSEEYNVSRNTIKRALLMLESEGLVTVEQNKSARVRSYSKREVLEFLEIREYLEGLIVKLAIPNLDTDAVKKLKKTHEEMKQYFQENNLLGYSECNRAFHKLISENCPNKTLVDLTYSLKMQMSKYNSKTILIPGRIDQSIDEHSAILNAIINSDEHAAEMAMRKHIENVRTQMELNYELLF